MKLIITFALLLCFNLFHDLINQYNLSTDFSLAFEYDFVNEESDNNNRYPTSLNQYNFAPSSNGFIWDEPYDENLLFDKTLNERVRVFWWNILDGGEFANVLSSRQGIHPILKNLQALLSSESRPQVLIMSEYYIDRLDSRIKDLLENSYSYHEFVSYYPHDHELHRDRGIIVFSDFLLSVIAQSRIDWIPLDPVRRYMGNDKGEEFRHRWRQSYPMNEQKLSRVATLLSVKVDDRRSFLLAPFHANQPWLAMKRQLGEFRTGVNILWGRGNPNYYQLQRFNRFLRKHAYGRKEPLVVIGDFNIPWYMKGVRTASYSQLAAGLVPVFPRVSPHSHPSASAQKEVINTPKVLIDYALTRRVHPNNVHGKVLPMMGSDHYPIMVYLNMD